MVASIDGFLRMPLFCVHAIRACPPCGRAYPVTSSQTSLADVIFLGGDTKNKLRLWTQLVFNYAKDLINYLPNRGFGAG